MRPSSPLLLSAFLATATGQTFTFDFPPTGTGIGSVDYYQVCVKGAKWADLITTNFQEEEFRYDISSTDFRDGDKMDGNWGSRYAVNIPDNFECKGGILFQADSITSHTNLDLTLKATLADGESKLTVCAFYTFFYSQYESEHWPDTLPALGFTESLRLFQKTTTEGYGQHYNPDENPHYNQINTLCREFDSVTDAGYFDEAEPLPATVSYTFPEVGTVRIMSGVCIKGASFASATNSVADYPELRMTTRKFDRLDSIWMEEYFFETNRNIGYGTPMADFAYTSWRRAWTDGHPCDGALYLQPQTQAIVGYRYEDPRFSNHWHIYSESERSRLGSNTYTIEILPEANESSVQICALKSHSYYYTDHWFLNQTNIWDLGYTSNGLNADINGFEIFCKNVEVPPTSVSQETPIPPTTTVGTDNTRVTMKLHL